MFCPMAMNPRNCPLRSITEQLLKSRSVLRGGDHKDFPDSGKHQRRERIVDHRLVVDREELLADAKRDREQASSASPGQNDAAPHS